MKKFLLLPVAVIFFCFLSDISYSQAPSWLWAKSSGGTSADYGNSVAVDASGNSYITGYFTSPTITFGFYTLTNTNSTGDMWNVFLTKYDANGNVLWAKSAGGIAWWTDDCGISVAVDASGNSYITGAFNSPTITFGSYTLTNTDSAALMWNVFLTKYDADGNVLWAKSAGGPAWQLEDCDEGTSVVVDASGNVFLTGYFESQTIIFGPDTLTNAGYSVIFLVKYDANGNVLWAKSSGETDNGFAISLAGDAFGNTYVTGEFIGPIITFGSDTLINPSNERNVFLVKYDTGRSVLWAKNTGGTSDNLASSVAVDTSGNAYLTGCFKGSTITFGSDTLTNDGLFDIFLAKYDAGGNVLWAKSAGGTSNDFGNSVSVDAFGDAYLTGQFSSSAITFGNYTLTNAGGGDIFLAIYNNNGNVLWATSAGGTSDEDGQSVAVDASGDAFVAGWFGSHKITFGSDTLTNVGNNDIFLAKLEGIPVGVNELIHSESILVYPNPATDKISIKLHDDNVGSIISILDIEGQQLLQQTITAQTTTIDISPIPEGMYFVKVFGKDGALAGKLIKN
jgi:hypothetical protein